MADLPIVRTLEEAKLAQAAVAARGAPQVLVEVPANRAATMMWLAKMLDEPDDSPSGKLFRQVKQLVIASRVEGGDAP